MLRGECSCLKVRSRRYAVSVPHHANELAPMAGSAAEIWFLGMQPGPDPENHIIKITAEWIPRVASQTRSSESARFRRAMVAVLPAH